MFANLNKKMYFLCLQTHLNLACSQFCYYRFCVKRIGHYVINEWSGLFAQLELSHRRTVYYVISATVIIIRVWLMGQIIFWSDTMSNMRVSIKWSLTWSQILRYSRTDCISFVYIFYDIIRLFLFALFGPQIS